MGEDGVHGVAGLLARDAQILLQRPHNGGEDGLGRLVGVHRDTGACKQKFCKKKTRKFFGRKKLCFTEQNLVYSFFQNKVFQQQFRIFLGGGKNV